MRSDSVVILVSDGPSRDFLSYWYKGRGVTVTHADDKTDIVQAIADAEAGVLVTDRLYRIGFRRLSIQQIKSHFPELRIVAVPVRGYLEGDMESLARAVGADAVLSDPLTARSVSETLE
jgi:hypothetical protein